MSAINLAAALLSTAALLTPAFAAASNDAGASLREDLSRTAFAEGLTQEEAFDLFGHQADANQGMQALAEEYPAAFAATYSAYPAMGVSIKTS